MENVSRQVRRAEERHQTKVDRAIDNGRRYPAAKYRPVYPDGRFYEANGKREMTRRVREAEGRANG